MAETNAILNFQGKDDGFSKILNAASDGFDRLADGVGSGKEELAKLRDESGLFEKAFKGLTGTLRKGQDTFDAVGDGAGAIASSFTTSAKVTDITNQGFVKIAASALGLGKQVSFVNTVLGPLGDLWHDVDDAQSAVGKGFAVLNAVSKPLIGSLKSVADFSADVADKLSGMGAAGSAAAGVFLGLSKTLGSLGTGVKIADIAGDMYRLVEATKEFAEEQLPELIDQAKSAAEMFDKLGVKTMLFGDKLKTIRTIATALSAVGKGAVKELAQLTIKFLDFREQVKMFTGMATAIRDAYLRLKGLNEGFETFQAMGVDTSMAELAVQIGVVGEGLLTNAEAAKNFAKVTVTAFAQVEDKLAYLQTLSTAAGEGTGKLFANMQVLTSGPLKNLISNADAAQASYYAMSAGADTLAKSNMLMTATGKAAIAGQIDQAQAINAVTNAMAPMKINMRDTAKVLGQFAATTEVGQLDMGNLTGAIGELSSASSAANIPLEQTLGIYAKLTQTGPPGEAATRLGNLLQDITNFSGPAQDELDKLGVRIDKFTIQQKDLLPVLQDLYKKAGGNIQSLRKIFANDYSFQAFYSLVQDIEGAGKTIEQVSAAGADSLDKMFDKRRESTMMKAQALMNGFKGVMEEFGQRMLPMLTPFIDFLNNMLERFKNMPEPMKQFIAASALTAIGLNKLTEVGGTFTGMLFNLGKMYLMARVSSLLWSGQLLNEGKILRDMVVNQKDYAGALMRLFGIQQQGANVMTTVVAAQQEAAKASALGKQAEDARSKATTAQVAASKLAEKAEKLKATAVTLSAEADQAATVAAELRAEAEAAGGVNAKLNAEADEAAAVSARSRALADEASAKASQAQAAADLKTVEATKANQAAKDLAHNTDLANKNASIRASQAAAAAEVSSAKLSEAAVLARSKASQATQAALDLEAVAAEKAAVATAAKAAADEAGGNNALLNAKAIGTQQAAQTAQVTANKAATKAIELNNAATIAETRSIEAAALAQSTKAEAELATAFATKKATEATVENTVVTAQNKAVSLADDTSVTTIDYATGAVEANSTATAANTEVKAANAAVSLADDDEWQTLEVVNGVVEVNTAQVAANTEVKAAHAATTAVDTTAEAASSTATEINTEEKAKNTTATVVNTEARGLLGKINAFLTGEINLQNIAMFKNTMAMKSNAGAIQSTLKFTDIFAKGLSAATDGLAAFTEKFKAMRQGAGKFSLTDLVAGGKQNFTASIEAAKTAISSIPDLIKGGYTNALGAGKKATELFAGSLKGVQGGAKGFLGFLNTLPGLLINGVTPGLGMAAGATSFLTGAISALWTALAPLLPIVVAIGAAITAFMVFKEIGQMLGWVGSEFSKTGKEVSTTTTELQKMREELGKTKDETAKPVEKDKGWLHETLKYIGLTRDETQKYTGFLNTVVFPLLNTAANLITLPFRLAGDAIKGVLNLFTGGKAGKAIDELGKKVGDAGKKLANAITFGKLEEQINSLDGTVNGFFKMVKDGAQEMMERPMTEAFQKQDEFIQKMLLDGKKLEWQTAKGKMASDNAQKLLDKAKEDAVKRGANALDSKMFDDVTKANREAVQAQTKLNDEAVQRLTKQLEDPKIKEARKAQLQVQVDALNKESAALDENLKKQEKYLQNIQAIAGRIDENNANLSSDNTIKNLKTQQGDLMKLMKDSPDDLKARYNDLFGDIETGMNNTSTMQRRVNNQLITGIKDFLDNAKTAKDVSSAEDLQKMQQEADAAQERIMQAFDSGAISQELAQKLLKEIGDLEIDVDTPDFKFKGSILTPEQQQSLIEAAGKVDQGIMDRRVSVINEGIEKINAAESQGLKTAGQAQKERLRQQAEIDKLRVENAKATEARILEAYGAESPQYLKAQQDRRAAERALDKTNYEKRQADADYYTDRRVKTEERAIAKIKSLVDQQKLTEGQGAIATAEREAKINDENVARLKKRLADMSDTTSDAYKDLQAQLEQLETDGVTKRLQIRRQKEDYALERRVKVHQDAIAELQHAETTFMKTQGEVQIATLQKEQEISKERLKLALQRLEEIRKASGENSDVYKDQAREVRALERDIEAKAFQERRAKEDYALDRRVKKHEEAIEKIQAAEQLFLKTQGQAQQETLKQEIAINNERLKLARTRLADIGKRAGVKSDVYQDQLREVNKLERDSLVKRFQLQRSMEDYALDRRVKVHEEAIAEIALSEKLLQRTQFEAGQETLKQELAINAERQVLARKRLEDLRKRAGENSDTFIDQQRALRALEREQIEKSFQLKMQAVVHELEVQQQRITNQVEAQNQAYKAQLNQIDQITAKMQLQQELAESRNTLLQAGVQGLEQQLDGIGKLASDERLSAQLQAVSAQARLDALGKAQAFERDNLKRGEATKKLALDRQKIELQSNKLANQRAIAEENINFRRLQATQKVTAEQVEQHRLALSNLQQQDTVYQNQEENLNEQIAAQAELNQNAREEQDIRQRQAKDGGVMDVLLAKQQEMTAQIEKEKSALEKRNEVNKARNDAYAGQLSILSQTTNSERKQRDIAAAIAAIKLNSLAQQQEGERKVLEMQIKQREAVLEQEKSRIRMMEAENKSRLAEAKERVITAIAEGKSTEQIQARLDALKGYAEASAAIKGAGQALEARGKYEAQLSKYELAGQAAQQIQEGQQAKLELAQNLPIGQQRELKEFIQGEVFNQLGVGWGNIESMGRNAAYNSMAQGYDRRSAFPALTPLEAPKPVDYEALRKDALAQLNEFVVPQRSATPQQAKQVEAEKSRIEALQKTVDAIAKRQPNQLDQQNTFNIHLPAGSSTEQAKSLEEPLIKLQMDIWQGVRKELGL
ncbi:hypothetical protein [Allocoleopsis sp.]|uniref:hypothetical protein n=1 Tax=Allocoleopsis sp. TaxID=3088169 RepID=UPI002FCEEF1D